MDTSAAVRYRGEALQTRLGSSAIEIVDGLRSGPMRRGDDQRIGGMPGAYAVRREGDVLDILLAGHIKGLGPTPSVMTQRFDQRVAWLKRLFDPRRGLGELEATLQDGTVLTTQAQATDAIQWGDGLAWYRKLAIPMVSPLGQWFLPTASVDDDIAASPTDLELIHPGNEHGFWTTITLEGPLDNPRITNLANGIYVECLVPLAAGQTLTLVGRYKTAVISETGELDINAIASVRHAGDFQWLWLEPGANTLRVTSDTTGGHVTIDFEPPW